MSAKLSHEKKSGAECQFKNRKRKISDPQEKDKKTYTILL